LPIEPTIEPKTPEELADALATAASKGMTIALGGHFSKRSMGGPVTASDVTITTKGLKRILQYEPTDLTLSVEAGASFAEVSRVLAENHQMIPLDPPFADTATVGGVIATNGCGPRRRLYGSARDHVIGMQFATLEGKLVQSGGMVVKNVAGLDMGKLMIGSFGTLAAITVVNFKLSPKPAIERTCLLSFEHLDGALAVRDKIIRSVLQPAAIDLLNPLAAAQVGHRGYVLAVQFGGNAAVVARYERELSPLGHAVTLEGADEARFWRTVQNYSQHFVEKFFEGAVVRVSSTLTQMSEVLASLDTPVVARAASGICYAYFTRTEAAVKWLGVARQRPWRCVMEFAPEPEKERLELWPVPGDDFAMMKKVKQMFDPGNLLNHGRLYRLI
jgi:glycolate oxidase FAD binding subunit